MSNLIRAGNTQYAGNFSNNLVSKIGCEGTTCNKVAARESISLGEMDRLETEDTQLR